MSKPRPLNLFFVLSALLILSLSPAMAKDQQRYLATDLFSLASYTKQETMISVESGIYSDQKNGIYETVQSYLKPTNIYFPSQCFDTALKAFKQDTDKRLTLVFDLNNIKTENDHLQLASEPDAPEGSTRGSFLRVDSCKEISLEPASKFNSKN
jgi:hypothetical protein